MREYEEILSIGSKEKRCIGAQNMKASLNH